MNVISPRECFQVTPIVPGIDSRSTMTLTRIKRSFLFFGFFFEKWKNEWSLEEVAGTKARPVLSKCQSDIAVPAAWVCILYVFCIGSSFSTWTYVCYGKSPVSRRNSSHMVVSQWRVYSALVNEFSSGTLAVLRSEIPSTLNCVTIFCIEIFKNAHIYSEWSLVVTGDRSTVY